MFQQVTQIPAFVRALRENIPTLACLVHSVTLSCYIPPNHRDLVDECMAFVFKHCINLVDINCTPYTEKDVAPMWTSQSSCFLTALLEACPRLQAFSNIHHPFSISTSVGTPFRSLCPAVEVLLPAMQHNLVSLSLQLPVSLSAEEAGQPLPNALHLPHVESLSLDVRAPNAALASINTWVLPKLTRCTLSVATEEDWTTEGRRTALLSLLTLSQTFGPLLTELDISAVRFGPLMTTPTIERASARAMLARCSRLRTLCISQRTLRDASAVGNVRALVSNRSVHIDVYVSAKEVCDILRYVCAPGAQRLLPNVRLVDKALRCLTALPRFLPSPLVPSAVVVHRVLGGLTVVQTRWVLCRADFPWFRWGLWQRMPEVRALLVRHPVLADHDGDAVAVLLEEAVEREELSSVEDTDESYPSPDEDADENEVGSLDEDEDMVGGVDEDMDEGMDEDDGGEDGHRDEDEDMDEDADDADDEDDGPDDMLQHDPWFESPEVEQITEEDALRVHGDLLRDAEDDDPVLWNLHLH